MIYWRNRLTKLIVILKELGIKIKAVKSSQYGSFYIDSSIGFIRYSNHPRYTVKASQRKLDLELSIFMSKEKIKGVLLSRLERAY